MRILIVEDNDGISETLFEGLVFANMIPTVTKDGRHADMMLATALKCGETYDAVVMDLTLPGMDGSEVIARLRGRSDTTPILILSGRSSTEDRVAGLDLGADDFLAKPYELSELIARIRAMVRRHKRWVTNDPVVGNLQFNSASNSFTVDGKPLVAPPRARKILEILFRRSGSPVSKDLLANLTDPGSSYESVDIQLSRIRKKLCDIGATVSIRTIYGQGYALHAHTRQGEARGDT